MPRPILTVPMVTASFSQVNVWLINKSRNSYYIVRSIPFVCVFVGP